MLGVLASFAFQVIYNITMSAGLAPVKGLTLPLMSYGGSSMIATLAGFGLILNVRMRTIHELTAGCGFGASRLALARMAGPRSRAAGDAAPAATRSRRTVDTRRSPIA